MPASKCGSLLLPFTRHWGVGGRDIGRMSGAYAVFLAPDPAACVGPVARTASGPFSVWPCTWVARRARGSGPTQDHASLFSFPSD